MTVPKGTILIWSGAIVDIPAGFVLCDGNNETPDLRDKFVVGSGSTYNPGDSAGSLNHNHTFTSSGHTHTLPAGVNLQAGSGGGNVTDTNFVSGTTNNASSLPPYYSLAYIMKT